MAAGWPRNVIVTKRDAAPLASRCENPIGREYRSVDRPRQLYPSVSLRVSIEREGEGS